MVGSAPSPAAVSALVRATRATVAWETNEPADAGTWPRGVESLRETAGRHRIAPVLAPWRDRLGLERSDADWLAAAQRANATKALAAARRSHEVVAALDAAQVRTLVLKGLPLALRTTGNLAGRHCGDIDVLADPGELERADATLRSLGFTLRVGAASSPFRDPHRRWVLTMDNHVPYWHEDGTHLELHWRLTRYDLLPLRFEQLWSARAEVGVGEASVAAPGDLHDRLFVLVHAAKHDFQRLQWAIDVVRLLRDTTDEAWTETVEAAHDLGIAVLIEACARFSDRLAATPLPTVSGLRDADRRRVARLVETMWTRCLHGDATSPGWIRQPLSLRTDLRYRAWVLARNAVPPFLLDTVDGPRLLRPARLVGQKVLGRTRPG